MRTVSSATAAALAARALKARSFLWITARISESDATPVSVGFWDDIGVYSALVVDPATGEPASRNYYGTGTLIAIDDIPLTSDVSVREVNVTLSQVNAQVAAAVRGYDIRYAPIQIHRGLFNPGTRTLADPAELRFAGFVDTCVITTPKKGTYGQIALTCVSQSRELTRGSTETRSDASQRARTAGADGFYRYAGVTGGWTVFWGGTRRTAGSRPAASRRSKG